MCQASFQKVSHASQTAPTQLDVRRSQSVKEGPRPFSQLNAGSRRPADSTLTEVR